MNAIISGRNAVALLLDGDHLKSFHADAIDTLVPRKLADLPFLFGDGNDLQFLENVTCDEAATRLRRERDNEEALQLLLILLDPELSKEVRQEAAEALEELLADELLAAVIVRFGNLPAETLDKLQLGESATHQYLRNVMYAHHLPNNADMQGAIQSCKQSSAVLVQDFLETLNKLQPIIHKIHLAWEAIPNANFGSDEMRAKWHADLVREGVFQDLVMKIARGKSVGTIQAPSLPESVIKTLPEFDVIQRLWIEPLRHEFTGTESLILKDETEAEELAHLIREKLSELPEEYKQVMELLFYQDHREREAAEKLGIPVDRLYSIKSDALKRLRKLCAKDARFKTAPFDIH
jgi:RNA polymerase sigma-70 factor (ECF subfamily)